MKFYLVALFAVFAVVSGAVMPVENFHTYTLKGDNFIDKLVKTAMEVVRKMLKDHEPFEIPDLPSQHFKDKDFNVDIQLQNVKVSQASDFHVDHIENNLPGMWATFGVTVPKLHLEGQYKVTGKVANRDVNGIGKFAVDIDTMVQTGKFYLTMVNHAVQMKELDLDYTLKGLKFDLKGLQIEGMSKEQVEQLLNEKFFEYLQTHKKDVCDVVSRQVTIAANKIMQGKNLKQLLDWLKNFVSH